MHDKVELIAVRIGEFLGHFDSLQIIELDGLGTSRRSAGGAPQDARAARRSAASFTGSGVELSVFQAQPK